MIRNTLTASAALLALLAVSAPAQTLEMGRQAECRLVDLSPNDSFTCGQTSIFQIQAGVAGIEGYFCTVWQEYAEWDNYTRSMPGLTGDLFINQNRPFHIFSEGGPLTGGVLPGRSVVFQYTFPTDPALVGVQFIVQAYVTDETRTTHSFTTALVGTMK